MNRAQPPLEAVRRLLKPRSIAIVGASPTPGSLGAGVLANVDRFGFDGAVHLVNPRRTEIAGRPCVASVADLPACVDCVVLAVPRDQVVEAVRACAARGVGGVIILAGGFAEQDEAGAALQAEIARIAEASGMAVLGPNCLGMINYVDRVPLLFGAAAAPAAAVSRGVAVVSQSGAMAAVVRVALQARGIDLTFGVSTGNEAVCAAEDVIEALLEDPSTRVLTLLMEQVRDPQRFLALARRARARGLAIVLLHLGRSAAGQAAAQTHTGALTGDYAVMESFVARTGVVLAESLEELIDATELLFRFGRRPGAGVAVISESGAFKGMALDYCETVGIALPPLSPGTHAALAEVLPWFAPPSNPVDLTAQALVQPELYGQVIARFAADPSYGSIVIAITLPSVESAERKMPPILDALARAGTATPIVFAMLGEDCEIPTRFVAAARDLGVPFLRSPERAFRALAALGRHSDLVDVGPTATSRGVVPLAPGLHPEHRAKALLASHGLKVPAGALATFVDQAVEIADRVGYPVVLKAQAVALPHKSDAGGVILALADAGAVRAGWARLQTDVGAARPDLVLDGVLVEAMGARGIELILGVKHDSDWGPVVLIGMGGVQAELMKDAALVPAGAPVEAFEQAILSLRSAALLTGFRGSPPADVKAAGRAAAALGAMALAHPEIAEIDVNPLMVLRDGQGAVALDALVLVRTDAPVERL